MVTLFFSIDFYWAFASQYSVEPTTGIGWLISFKEPFPWTANGYLTFRIHAQVHVIVRYRGTGKYYGGQMENLATG